MVITFKELGVKVSDYTGYPFYMARAEVINIACDYVMVHHFPDRAEYDVIIEPQLLSEVDFILQTVDINTIEPTVH